MMASKGLEDNSKKGFLAQKLHFKRVTLGNWSHKTTCRAVKWAHIRNSNVPRVTSGCVEDIIPLSQVSLSPKNRGYMGVVYKKQIFPNLDIFMVALR